MLYRFARGLLAIIITVWFRPKFEGRENLPAEGGCIVAANHMSYVDPPLVGIACLRPVNFMAKAELFKIPVLGSILPRIRAFPVHRGAADRVAIRRALELLDQGEVVGVFPEGTRNRKGGDLLEPQGGAALLALKAGVPVVPVAVWGTDKIDGLLHLPRPVRIGVRFGQPLHFPGVERIGREDVAAASKEIMDAIKKMLDDVRNS